MSRWLVRPAWLACSSFGLFGLAGCSGTQPADAAIVVSPDGDDQNSGTAAAPLRTVKHALELAKAGDTIRLRPGDYVASPEEPWSYTPPAGITLRGDSSATTHLWGPALAGNAAFVLDATFALDGYVITASAPSDFQLKQMQDILRSRLTARSIDVRCLDVGEPEINLATAKQKITVKQGLEQPMAKKIIAAINAAKLKVETQINGEKLRVTGKKRDDLQTAIALLRKSEFEVPLQFDNFRD